MSAAPLTREERDRWIKWAAEGNGDLALERIIATLQAAEERAEALTIYTRHLDGCGPGCTCGLLVALAADDAKRGAS